MSQQTGIANPRRVQPTCIPYPAASHQRPRRSPNRAHASIPGAAVMAADDVAPCTASGYLDPSYWLVAHDSSSPLLCSPPVQTAQGAAISRSSAMASSQGRAVREGGALRVVQGLLPLQPPPRPAPLPIHLGSCSAPPTSTDLRLRVPDFELYRDLLRVVPCCAGHVLEVGCGNSRLGEELLREGVAGGVTCIDLSPVAVQRMRDRLAEQGTSGKFTCSIDLPFLTIATNGAAV